MRDARRIAVPTARRGAARLRGRLRRLLRTRGRRLSRAEDKTSSRYSTSSCRAWSCLVDVVVFRCPARGSQGPCSSSRYCCRPRGEEWWTVLGADPPYQAEVQGSKRQPPTRAHGLLATPRRDSTPRGT